MSGHLFQQRVSEAGHDLTPVQFATLRTLSTNPGLDQAQIAAITACDRATIGGVIDRLEQKGYVMRTVSARDRRAREVSLTKTGLAIYEEILPVIYQLQDEILDGLSSGEREQFLILVRKLVAKTLPEDAPA